MNDEYDHEPGSVSFKVADGSVMWNGKEVDNRIGRLAVQCLAWLIGLWAATLATCMAAGMIFLVAVAIMSPIILIFGLAWWLG